MWSLCSVGVLFHLVSDSLVGRETHSVKEDLVLAPAGVSVLSLSGTSAALRFGKLCEFPKKSHSVTRIFVGSSVFRPEQSLVSLSVCVMWSCE